MATVKKPLPGMRVFTYADLLQKMEHPKYSGWSVVYLFTSPDGNTDSYQMIDETGKEMLFPTQVWSDACANLSGKEEAK